MIHALVISIFSLDGIYAETADSTNCPTAEVTCCIFLPCPLTFGRSAASTAEPLSSLSSSLSTLSRDILTHCLAFTYV